MGVQQRLHFVQELCIASGCREEERRALIGLHRRCRMIELTDLAVPLRRHHGLARLNSR
jgi:hypothetical protein